MWVKTERISGEQVGLAAYGRKRSERQLKFERALKLIRHHELVRRAVWSDDLYLIKRATAILYVDRDDLGQTDLNESQYLNQENYLHARSYKASAEDLLATDWQRAKITTVLAANKPVPY